LADVRRGLPRAIRVARRVEIEGLPRERLLDRRFEALWHPRGHLDDGAHRIAGVRGGEWPIHDIDPLNLRRRDQTPARRADAVVVRDQRGKQDAVGVYEAARAGTHAPGARGERGLRVAVV